MLELVSKVTDLPVALADVKEHLGISHSQDNDRLTALIHEALAYLESETDRSFTSTTYDLKLPRFPVFQPYLPTRLFQGYRPLTSAQPELKLPKPPLLSITSVQYYDTDNTLQTYSGYRLFQPVGLKAYLVPAINGVFPTTFARQDAVTVRFVSGYSTQPRMLEQFVKLFVAYRNEHREGEMSADFLTGIGRIVNKLKNWGV